jgi:hypothetical protein
MRHTSRARRTSASPTVAVLSGVGAGLLVVFIGLLANQVGQAFPGPSLLGPSIPAVAAALAATVSAHRSRAPLGMTLALAAGAFFFTYLVSAWVTHWMALGAGMRRRPLSPTILGWRRDLGVSFLGIAIGSLLGMFLGRR